MTRSEATRMRRWCIVTILASPVAGFAVEPIDPGSAWALASGAAMIAGMLLIITLIAPRSIWRISERGVWHAASLPVRKRVRIAWDEVEQLRLDHECICLRGRGKEILMRPRAFSKQDWPIARDMVRTCLADTFDLDTPTPWEVRAQALRSSIARDGLHWLKLILIAVAIAVVLVAVPFVAAEIHKPAALWVFFLIQLAALGLGLIAVRCSERTRWRRRLPCAGTGKVSSHTG